MILVDFGVLFSIIRKNFDEKSSFDYEYYLFRKVYSWQNYARRDDSQTGNNKETNKIMIIYNNFAGKL